MDLQKRFLIYQMYPKYLAAHLCVAAIRMKASQAARAEQERKILQEELWRQQQDFREVHQQNFTEMEELQKFKSSTFDTLTRQKFIEDQNTIMELSGRLQELQNEVNCMNDSKDFQDAESVRSGNSHVTSQPMLFPKHPPFEGLGVRDEKLSRNTLR